MFTVFVRGIASHGEVRDRYTRKIIRHGLVLGMIQTLHVESLWQRVSPRCENNPCHQHTLNRVRRYLADNPPRVSICL
jgi:hypothetical protein